MRKVKFTQECFNEKLDAILSEFPILDNLHPFLSSLMNVLYDKNHYKLALGQLNTARHLIDQVSKDYIRLMKFGDSLYRCKQLKRAAMGRMATVMRRQKDPLAYLEQVRQHIARLPSIDPTTRTLLICGYPNVGKSSFINKITRADVDVQPYAFTTKSLFVGHMDYKYLRWQVIDTPGILDHPLEEMNTIEMQSITAMAHLRSAILYFMDLSEQCGYTVEAQCKLFSSIKPLFANKPVSIVFNKIDVTTFDDLTEEKKKAVQEVLADGDVKDMKLSCMSEEGIMDVRNQVCETLLAHRVDTKMRGSKINSVVNRIHVAQPKPRDDVERTAQIPDVVKQRKGYDKEDPERRKLERDIEEANGGTGVYSVDLHKYYLLENDDWKKDTMPEFLNGHNVADFVDPDIEEKLEALEREEEKLEAEGFYNSDEDILDSEEEETRANAEAIRGQNNLIKLKSQDQTRKKKSAIMPRTQQSRTLSDMTADLASKGIDASNIEGRAIALAKSKGLVGKRKHDDVEMAEDDEGASDEEGMEVDEDKQSSKKSKGVAAADKAAHPRAPKKNRAVGGLGSKANEDQAKKYRSLAQREPARLSKASESDRHIQTTKPKWMLSGKRKMVAAMNQNDDEKIQAEAEEELMDEEDDYYDQVAVDKNNYENDEEPEEPSSVLGIDADYEDCQELRRLPHEERLKAIEDMCELYTNIDGFSEQFKLVDKLGEGTFSAVYKAIDLKHHDYDNSTWFTKEQVDSRQLRERSKVYVALKRIYVTSCPWRIQNELEMLYQLRTSKYVSSLITAIRHEDQVVAVMPYHPNNDFREFYRHCDYMTVKNYFRSLFRALKDIHEQEVIHRDVKPANFLFSLQDQKGVLCDFGLAQYMLTQNSWTDHCHHTIPTEEYPLGQNKLTNKSIRTEKDTRAINKTSEAIKEAERRMNDPKSNVGYSTDERRPVVRANRAGTRGFRAPEVLLKCQDQTTAIDIWSAGVILPPSAWHYDIKEEENKDIFDLCNVDFDDEIKESLEKSLKTQFTQAWPETELYNAIDLLKKLFTLDCTRRMPGKNARQRTKSEASLGGKITAKFLNKRKSQVFSAEEEEKKGAMTRIASGTTATVTGGSDSSSARSGATKKPAALRSSSSFGFLDKLSQRKRVVSLPATGHDIQALSDTSSSALPLLSDEVKRVQFRDRKKLRKSQETIHKVLARKADLLDYARRPPSGKQLFDASCCTLIGEDGSSVVFGSLYSTRRTIVILLRHAYCNMCQAYAKTVSEIDRSLPIVFILPTSYKVIASYRRTLKIPFPIYSDVTRSVYGSLGVKMRSNNPGTVKDVGGYTHNLTSWEAISIATRLTPTQPGDTKQLGAEFVLGPGAQSVHYTHRMITTRGHAPIKDVIRACMSFIPTQAGALRERVLSSPGAFNFPSPASGSINRLPPGASHPSLPNLHDESLLAEEQHEADTSSLLELTPSDFLGQTLPTPSPSLAAVSNYIATSGREAITPNLTTTENLHVVEKPQRPPRNFSRPSSLWIKEDDATEQPPPLPTPLPYPGIGTDTPRFIETGLRSPTPPALSNGDNALDSPDHDFFEIYSSYDKELFADDSYVFTPSATFQSLRAAFDREMDRTRKEEMQILEETTERSNNGVQEESTCYVHQKTEENQVETKAEKFNGIEGQLTDNLSEMDLLELDKLDKDINEGVKPKVSLKKRGSNILRRIENTARSQLQSVYPQSDFDSSFGVNTVNRFNSIPLWRPRIR
ncbi:hypothetical protein E3Q08_02532 [Wallemia mellicola]|nr:hypothetical protein E3Q08_02532 [Wallemia mellicola]